MAHPHQLISFADFTSLRIVLVKIGMIEPDPVINLWLGRLFVLRLEQFCFGFSEQLKAMDPLNEIDSQGLYIIIYQTPHITGNVCTIYRDGCHAAEKAQSSNVQK